VVLGWVGPYFAVVASFAEVASDAASVKRPASEA
jgi:hypothetical protein